jgi:WD40 repeat protein/serine/threonine protein kinase
MQICHACNGELDQKSIVMGKCPHCGALLRKLSARTIDDTRLRDEKGEHQPIELILDESEESIDLTPSDTDQGGATIELGGFLDLDQYKKDHPSFGESPLDATPAEPVAEQKPKTPTLPDRADMTMEFETLPSVEPVEEKPKTPTLPDRSDMTMEFPTLPSTDPVGEPPKKRHSTHSLESDKTIDLAMSPTDIRNLDSEWGGQFEAGARQGQTIRARETVTGFRSSLPVKSRYVRERKKSGSAPPKTLADVPDYELLDIIGEGGMGVVYAAHQSSIARTVAVKMLKPSAKVREEQRDKFISEAVVTGELDHPNIVPIYDLGSNDQGALFYSMKRVKGTPWDKVIHQKQLDENLSILLRVADAVAFAHAGGVIHRDLKPENVMLGDYGEVLVMDWGLARITPEFAHVDAVYQADSLGGTPAYMAPEMAKGPVESINKTSDVYLLGAILYEIIGGQPPHSGRDVMQCLMAASQNRIDPSRYDGELKEVALKAMATQQEDRYQTVKDFQEAVRVYQSHSESLVLSAHANQNLQKARAAKDYQLYARSLYGFQEALTLWSENHRARLLLTETQRDYAIAALENGDLDLAASLLDANQKEHHGLAKRIEKAKSERNARLRRLKMAKMAVASLIALVVTTVSVALFIVTGLWKETDTQRQIAVAAKEEESRQKQVAIDAKEQEEIQKKAALEAKAKEETQKKAAIAAQEQEKLQREKAEAEEQKAILAKQAEEYEAYIAQIGLANAKIGENAYDSASDLMDAVKPSLRNWEWGRLKHLTQLSAGSYQLGGPVDTVAYSPDGQSIASGDLTGKLTVRDVKTGQVRFEKPHGQVVITTAYSPDSKLIATGSSDKTIQLWNAATGDQVATLKGHTGSVLSVRFSNDGRRLVSGSQDKSARVWDVATGEQLQVLKGHSWWVWSADFSPDGNRIVTAGQDGKAIVWAVSSRPSAFRQGQAQTSLTDGRQPTADSQQYIQSTEFTGHDGAVFSARFSPDGKLVASGGYDKLVMVWNPDEVQPIDIANRLDGKPDAKVNYVRLSGHEGPVHSVEFSPSGKLVLSGSDDNTVRVWDLANGEAKALRGHGSIVRSCAFSPDGNVVLSGGDDESVRLWNVRGYQEVKVLHATVFSGHEDAVLAARYSQDGSRVVTASRDRTASLWNAGTGTPIQRFQEGHEFLVSSVVVYPDGKHLATGAGDNSVRVWDATAGTQTAVMMSTGRIGTIAVSPDGKWLATGSTGTAVQLWDPLTGKALGRLDGHEYEVSALRFSPSGDRLASGDNRGHVKTWRLENVSANSPTWTLERDLEGHNGSISDIRFTPDGKRLVTASGDHTCGQWDLATGEELRDLALKHFGWVSSLDLSADGKLALTTCDDGMARLWQLETATPVAAVKSAGEPFNSGSFSPDSSRAVLVSSADKVVRMWNVSPAAAGLANAATEENATDLFFDFKTLGGEVWSASFAPDGQHLITIGGNDSQMWDVESHRPTLKFSPHGPVASAAISPNGKLVATGSWDHSAKIWDIETGHAIHKLEGGAGGHTGNINSVQFSPDGKQLLTASDDHTARLWDVKTGKPTDIVLKGHTDRVMSATFSPNGAQILTVSADKTAQLWDSATGAPNGKPFAGHTWPVLCGAFSTDGSRIITGSQDKSAILWKVETREKLQTLDGHTAAVTSVAFSPDPESSRAITGSQDNTAKLWDAKTGKEILSLPGHTQEVTSVSFSPDGLNVLTSSRDGTAIIWLAKDWRKEEAKTGNPF